jgi:uncharacterized membrane protein YphA (DoxX/SURF4 family)
MLRGTYTAGIFCYSIAVIGLGLIQLVPGKLMDRFFPGITTSSFLAYATGIVFTTAGIGLLFHRWRKYAAILTALVFLALLLYPHLPHLINDLYDPEKWTVFFQLVACCAGALLAAGRTSGSRMSWMSATGRYAFAISLLVFGIQHFMYAEFIQTLIPAWIPSSLLWSWLIRIAFIATAISLILGILVRLSGFLAAGMFLLWVLLFHIPRLSADTNKEAEWVSLFIAFAISGTCLLVADLSWSDKIINQFIKKKVRT